MFTFKNGQITLKRESKTFSSDDVQFQGSGYLGDVQSLSVHYDVVLPDPVYDYLKKKKRL